MKKTIITKLPNNEALIPHWLELDSLIDAEITSEDTNYPIEAALFNETRQGWRAGKPGTQTIRLLFKFPQNIHRMQLSFLEPATTRTQELIVRYSQDNGQLFHELVRQQWNFSPDGSTEEIENLFPSLSGVTTIELIITPDIANDGAFATLEKLRIA